MSKARHLMLALAVSATFAGSATQARAQEVILALPASNLGFAPAYVADEKGFWSKLGLKVKMPVISGIGSMNAVLSKSAQFSISSGLTIIRANIRGQKVIQIAETFDGLLEELVVSKKAAAAAGLTIDSPIQKRAQFLKGKTIAIAGANALPHGYLRLFARKGGLDPERDIHVAVMQPQAAAAALKSGSIAGFVETLPQPFQAIDDGYGMLLSSGMRGGPNDRGDFPELTPLALNGIMTRADYCPEQPASCEKMVQGIAEGMDYIRSHQKESADILMKRIPGMERKVFEKAFALWVKWMPESPKMNDERFAHAQAVMVQGGMIKAGEKLSAFSQIYTNKYVK
jgi:ABC-type nitrate/sulfonate/bicarbonate transport system substrate-binding protein